MNYVLGIDQSTQGTKVLALNEEGNIAAKASRPHRQLVSSQGWVSHDLEEIYQNLLACVREVAVALDGKITAVGLSNQRETSAVWRGDGTPWAPAVVWQCARATEIARRHAPDAAPIQARTGLRLSPFYPAAKLRWLLENEKPDQNDLRMGTVDTYLIYRLTGGRSYLTDASNASRTQLYNLRERCWDAGLCELFGVEMNLLPEIADSNADFGETDFEGILPHPVPIRAAMGDSHAALFGQGCHRAGSIKATYGTGSSVMMNTGERIFTDEALSSSVAFQLSGVTSYCLEGNINYSGAVFTWLRDDLGLIDRPEEVEGHMARANPLDETVLVPAFTGLSAPWWDSGARAAFVNMSRTTGRSELVRAAAESVAQQVCDVVERMRAVTSQDIPVLMADGGPTANASLMQLQSDLCGCTLAVPAREELSAIGAAYLAGISAGMLDETRLFAHPPRCSYAPRMEQEKRDALRGRWTRAVSCVLTEKS